MQFEFFGILSIAHDKHLLSWLFFINYLSCPLLWYNFHPLKFWLNSLDDWDKVPRIETLLVDYLGAEDTPYTRAVTRKTLIAAVARIFEPAIKFDNVLVLVGGQGIGKSTFFKKIAKQYFTDCLTLNDMKDKTAAEKISGYWIVEISELGGSRTADRELVKAFISRQDDTYRAAYGTTTESHPRQCIIVGTTNAEDGCLYDTTGNRRFFPVNVKGSTQKHTWDLSDETINQIWAEAKHYYDEGETLTMPKELTETIKEQQQNMLVTDDRVGIVKEWLEKHNYTQISKIELWCEFFGGTKETYDMKAQKQMKNIMDSITGWHISKHARTKYGDQRVYVVDDMNPVHNTVHTTVPEEMLIDTNVLFNVDSVDSIL